MRRGVVGIGAVVIAGVLAVAAAGDEPRADARRVEEAFQAVIARAEPAVACVLGYRETPDAADSVRTARNQDDTPPVPDYYGAGVVLSSNGLILTNYHVVRDAKIINVRLPGLKDKDGVEGPPRGGTATVYAADNRSDLAVLKLLSPVPPYTYLTLGRGEDLRKGSLVLALGHPYAAGYRDGSPSASWGIVGNLRRRAPTGASEREVASKALIHLSTLIQTDVRLQLGSSGGALLDLDGRLVGLTTAQAALTGVDMPGGFALPIDENVRKIIGVLLQGKEVEYGFLGVSTATRGRGWPGRSQPHEGRGVRIGTVVPNSPAWQRLQPGDVILRVNGQAIRDQDDLFLQLGTSLAGRPAAILVQRSGEPWTEDVVLAKTPVNVPSQLEGVATQPDGRPVTLKFHASDFGRATVRPPDVYGLRVDYASVLTPPQEGAIPNGVVVREVEPGKPAKLKGLQEYSDFITAVNGNAVRTPADFYREAGRAVQAGESVRLNLRDGRTVTLP